MLSDTVCSNEALQQLTTTTAQQTRIGQFKLQSSKGSCQVTNALQE